jgi:SAM-dependent methyltransferase
LDDRVSQQSVELKTACLYARPIERERVCQGSKKVCNTVVEKNVDVGIDSSDGLSVVIRFGKSNLGLPRQWFQPLAAIRRRQVADVFLRRMAPIDQTRTLLDVGGPGPATLLLARHFSTVYAVNISREFLEAHRRTVSTTIINIQADGGSLPFPDAAVDFVFADNVIEHVRERQRFAAEIRRVARIGFLITTPNYWFPFEPHFHFPFFQFLPDSLKRGLLTVANFGFVSGDSREFIGLLTAGELRTLFPRAAVQGIGFLSRRIPETLIVWHRG